MMFMLPLGMQKRNVHDALGIFEISFIVCDAVAWKGSVICGRTSIFIVASACYGNRTVQACVQTFLTPWFATATAATVSRMSAVIAAATPPEGAILARALKNLELILDLLCSFDIVLLGYLPLILFLLCFLSSALPSAADIDHQTEHDYN
jgi:hypothetical protein